jgi:hypothetical protein
LQSFEKPVYFCLTGLEPVPRNLTTDTSTVKMSEVNGSLDAIEKMGSHAQKIEEYKKLADRLFQEKDVPSLISFLGRLADDSATSAVPTIISRQVLQDFVVQIFDSSLHRDQAKQLADIALTKLRARQSAFEEQITTVSEKFADILQVLFSCCDILLA